MHCDVAWARQIPGESQLKIQKMKIVKNTFNVAIKNKLFAHVYYTLCMLALSCNNRYFCIISACFHQLWSTVFECVLVEWVCVCVSSLFLILINWFICSALWKLNHVQCARVLYGGIDERKGSTSDTVHIQKNACREYVMNKKLWLDWIGLVEHCFCTFSFSLCNKIRLLVS